MRLKELSNQWRVYMNPTDYQRLKQQAQGDIGATLALELGAECGFRVNETAKINRGDWRKTTAEGVDAMFLTIRGKDTTGETEDGKYREPFLPPEVFETIAEKCVEDQIAPGDPLFSVSKRTVQKWIKNCAKAVAERTGNEDYRKISSHDLRAYFATDRLIRRGMKEEVVMEVGGWESRDTIEPYLHAKFDDVIAREFKDAGVY
jgi:integrase